MRDDLRHFIDTSMNGSSVSYELLGDGITSITEEFNAEEESKQYIHQKTPVNQVKSYQRSFDVDKEDCVEDAVQTWIDGLVDSLPVGASAQTSYVRFRLKDSTAEGKYKAFKIPCTVTVVSAGGDAGDYVHNVISVKQCGEQVEGVFDVATKTFA